MRLPWLSVAIFLAALLGCGPGSPESPPRTAVKVGRVERAGSASSTRYSARIEPARQVELAFQRGGYVGSISETSGVDGKPRILQEGDPVRAGMELAALRRTDYDQKL